MTDKHITIGCDIGGGHILSAAVDTRVGRIIDDSRAYVKVDNKASREQILETWATALNQSIRKAGLSSIAGIGFAMPGPFEYKTGRAMFEGNDKYEALYNVNIREELPEYLVAPQLPLRFMNDATSFAVGVSWLGEGKGHHKVVAITLGTGFGSAYIEDGVPVVHREDVAKQGCFWHLPYRDGIADDYFSTRWFVGEYEKLTGQKVKGVKEVAEAAGDSAEVRALFQAFGKNLGDFFVPWLKKFPAGILVIGGNISHALNLFGGALQQPLRENGIETHIAASSLMEDAALIGSARLFEDAFWDKVKDDLPGL
ncbi:MAG: ROK family protein [Phaeodactylibacter sp.]|nr:ROK family protein [Phaeodactylibacter sp.]MCB9052371.1 ROK family protein [Lewinellaceae bacterium]